MLSKTNICYGHQFPYFVPKLLLISYNCFFSLVRSCRELEKRTRVKKLTGAEFPSEVQAVEVVTLAVLPPHLTEAVTVAGALSTQAVASPTAHWTVRFVDAVGVIRWTVVLHRTLAPGAEATRMTLTYAALVGAVTVAAEGAVCLSRCLTAAAAGKVHSDFQRILEAKRLDGKSTALLFGTAPELGLDAK